MWRFILERRLFLLTIVAVSFVFPGVANAYFQFPESSTCQAGDTFEDSINYYFVVNGLDGTSPEAPFSSNGNIDPSKVKKIECIKFTPKRIIDIPIALFFSRGLFPANQLLAYNNGDVFFTPAYIWSDPNTAGIKDGYQRSVYPESDKVTQIGLETKYICTSPLSTSYKEIKGDCLKFYDVHDSPQRSIGNIFFLGREGDEIEVDFQWNGNNISLPRGQKETYEVSVTSDLSGVPPIIVSCENCKDIGIDARMVNTSQSILLTIDAMKEVPKEIKLKAKTEGGVSFVDEYILPVSITDVDCSTLDQNQCTNNAECWWYPKFSADEKCIARTYQVDCSTLEPAQCGTKDGSSYCVYIENTKTCTDYLSAPYEQSYGTPSGYESNILPSCAFSGTCKEVNQLLQLGINAGKYALGLIGSVALAFFVYGGFMMIISAGNAERVKKGRDILVAAIIGIVIAFSAYALINFVLDALNVSSDFRVIE